MTVKNAVFNNIFIFTMTKEYLFNSELQIASILSKSDWHNINVHTLLQNKDRKQPSINAYLGARYSRSADSITSIASEISEKSIDAAAKLEAIFQGYGHKSVGDMAELFLCLENLPMISAMRTFNINPVISGQERSTRYQDFTTPNYIKIPQAITISAKLRNLYEEVINEHLTNYRNLIQPTEDALAKHFTIDLDDKRELGALKSRVFDTVRYFLPLGLASSLGSVMSARNWSEYIGRLRGSGFSFEKELGDLIHELLKGNDELTNLGYIPEAEGLVRHSDENSTRRDSTQKIQELLKNIQVSTEKPICNRATDSFNIGRATDPVETMIKHYLLSLYPNAELKNIKIDNSTKKQISTILAQTHNHNNQIGNVAQMGAYVIDGYADHGILKDLNRHRSFERYVPLWDMTTSLEHEFNRPAANYFYLCDYLYIDELSDLLWEFQAKLSATYQKIIIFYELARKEVSVEFAEEFTRYLLPHAHATRYRFYASVDDLQYLINLRTRPGGHIAYRSLTYNWVDKLSKYDPFWSAFVENIPKVEADNRDQFINRS